jgi:hypothetical protein
MTRPRVAVLTVSEEAHRSRQMSWQQLAHVDFVPMESCSDLSRELARQRFDGLILEHACSTPEGRPLWSELANAYPSLPIAVWGAEAQTPEGRSAPVYGITDDDTLAEFLSVDVVGVTRGRLNGVSLASVLQMLHMEQRSCRLRVRSGTMLGELFVRNGSLIHGALRSMDPRSAALTMLAWSHADVVFDRLPPRTERTIDESLEFLLIEAARLLDESQPSNELATAVLSGATTASWLVPAVLRGDAEALCAEVIKLPGAVLCAVVDFEHRLQLAFHARSEDRAHKLAATLSDLMTSIAALFDELTLRSNTEDVLITAGSEHLLLRPLRTNPTLVLFASFDRGSTSLGLVRAQLSKLAQDFGSHAA